MTFLVVGGYAAAFHGAPRFTGDLDLLVRPTIGHVQRMLEALRTFGFPASEIKPDYLLERKKIVQMGRVPVQVRVMTTISGVSWDDAWQSRTPGEYGQVSVFFLGREALLANKRAAARSKDLADIEALERLRQP